MKKLLLTGAYKYTSEQLNQILDLGYDITFVHNEMEPLQVDVADIDVLVCNDLLLHNDIKRFKNLKMIQLTIAGLNKIPLGYLDENGIRLRNARGVYSIPMAEWVVMKILEIYKKSHEFHSAQKRHHWEKDSDLLEMTGKTAAIIGYGSVGTEIAKRLQPFEVHLIGVGRRSVDPGWLNEYCLISELEQVLKKSDIVIITLPLSEETHHLIDTQMINVMKDQGVLINVSRGAVIDQEALMKAIERGKFLGVALDVFEEEPLPVDNPLWDFGNVIVTPHNSFASDKVNERLYAVIYSALMDFIHQDNGE